MSMPFRQIFQDYTLLTPELRHSKLKTYTSRWKGCVSLVGSWFGNAIAAYYAKNGYPVDVEQKVTLHVCVRVVNILFIIIFFFRRV